jgi:excisionase family DNA binding protein
MTEGRIQDWIRYVQDRAEHVEESPESAQTLDDSSTHMPSEFDESSSHNTSQPASQPATQTVRSASAGLKLPRPAAVSLRENTPAREGAPAREGRILPSLTAQAVRRSVARARSQAAQNAAETSEIAQSEARGESVAVEIAVDEIATEENIVTTDAVSDAVAVDVLPRTRRGRRAKNMASSGEADETNSDGRVRQRVRQRPETRAEMLDRLMNPTISLYEASVLLDVCAATVRRYTNSGLLPHVRTEGGQRRFRLRDVLALLQQLEARKNH